MLAVTRIRIMQSTSRLAGLVGVKRLAAIATGEGAVAEHVDILAHEPDGRVGATKHGPSGVQAAEGSIVPGIGKFRVDRISHVLAGIEERAAAVGVVAAGPRP